MKILKSVSFLAFFLFVLTACNVGPKPIAFENDDCDYCKMTISDTRFGAELVTKKGRIYKFDDISCMKGFVNDEEVPGDQIHSLWVVDFHAKETLIPVETSFLLQNEELKSPMGSNIGAFADEPTINDYHAEFSGTILTWEEYLD